MTLKFDDVYLKSVGIVAGKLERYGTFGKFYDKTYNDYYMGEKTFEQAEERMIKDATSYALSKSGMRISDIDVVLGADLLNQIASDAYESVSLNKPFLGLYSACASLCEELLVASLLVSTGHVKNALCNVSSHNLTAERQFRNPVEYGCPKPKRSTYTVTGAGSAIITNTKSKIRISAASIGTTTDLGIKDVSDMGSVMAPAAARTIYEHLKNLKARPEDYDLILTGDLGVYGKEILKSYMKSFYNLNVDNVLEDAGSIIYDRAKQKVVKAGGSGPACISLVSYTDVFNKMIKGKLKKVMLVSTGALMSTTMNNQHLTIPSIAHAVTLEVVK